MGTTVPGCPAQVPERNATTGPVLLKAGWICSEDSGKRLWNLIPEPKQEGENASQRFTIAQQFHDFTLFLEARFVREERYVNTTAKIAAADLGTAGLRLSHSRAREQRRGLTLAVSGLLSAGGTRCYDVRHAPGNPVPRPNCRPPPAQNPPL